MGLLRIQGMEFLTEAGLLIKEHQILVMEFLTAAGLTRSETMAMEVIPVPMPVFLAALGIDGLDCAKR